MLLLISLLLLYVVSAIANDTAATTTAALNVPSLYIFGDSFVDSGNNNSLNTSAKCNHPPYGINFDGDRATGRWTDGLLITDYIASFLGLPYPANFQDSGSDFTSGANFACASAGILNETGIGEIRTFEEQISDFWEHISQLQQQIGSPQTWWKVSRSIFYINIGTNDVANAFRSSGQLVGQELDTILLRTLAQQLLKLYAWGARKFVVVSAAIIGCPPLEIRSGPCLPLGEASARSFNTALQSLLRNLTISHVGMSMVYANLHDLMAQVIQQPAWYGFLNVADPCCPLYGSSWCSSSDAYCANPSQYMFWDIAHPSNAFNRLAAHAFWNGSLLYSFPLNIRQLASLW